MSAIVWVLAAMALVAWPAGSVGASAGSARRRADAGARHRGADDVPGRAGVSVRSSGGLLVVGGAVAPAALAVAAFGPVHGVAAAVVLAPVGVAAVQWLRRRPAPVVPDHSVALTLDLVAAVLRSGRPVPAALALAAPAAGPDARTALERTARLLALGADPQMAWRPGSGAGSGAVLAPVAEVAVRSHSSGARLADAFERLAAELRADRSLAAVARARRAGVHALGPLAACFLPSFVCLGIVPVVVGIASGVLRSVTS